MQQKRNIKGLLDSLVDKDGLKTEVTINITNRTLTRLSLTLLATGIAIIVISKLAYNFKVEPRVKSLIKK